MGGNQNHHNQHYVRNNDPFAKVKFSIPPFNGSYDAEAYLDWEMTIEQKFSSHLVHEVEHKSFRVQHFNEVGGITRGSGHPVSQAPTSHAVISCTECVFM
jgi:hypothetical protein